MTNFQRTLLIVIVAGMTWWLASWWCVNPAERFYAAVPLAAVAYLCTGRGPAQSLATVNSTPSLQGQLRLGAVMFVGLILAGTCLMTWGFGTAVLLSWRFWLETGVVLYLMAGLLIVLLGFFRLLLWGTELLARRWQCSPAVGKLFATTAALALFITLAIPFGIAFSFTFRFKVSNLTDPRQALGRDYEDVEFTSADGTQLRGWWIPAKKASTRTLVLCHGLAVNRTITLPFCAIGDWLDANIFMFDLRGHGDSGGRTISLGYLEKDDVLAAIAYVREQRPQESRQVIGMGLSLGAAATAEAAATVEPPLNGVILDSSFSSTAKMTHHLPLPASLHSWLLAVGVPLANWHAGCSIMSFSPETSIGQLRAPVAFLHSRHDPVTPSSHSVALFEQAVEPKQLHIFEVGGHTNGFFCEPDNYKAVIGKLAKQIR